MDTTIPPSEIITLDGGCRSELRKVRDSSQASQGDQRVNNKNNLDGNQNPNPYKDNGVGPNRDDYAARNTCTKTETPGETGGSTGGQQPPGRPVVEDPAQPAVLALRSLEAAVGAPGSPAFGAIDLINATTTDTPGLSVLAASLVSGPNVIPASAVSFDPGTLDASARSTYTIAVTVQIPANQASGFYSGTVTVRNPDNVQTQTNIAVVVNRPPILTVPGPQTVAAGDTLSFDISTADPDGDPMVLETSLLPKEPPSWIAAMAAPTFASSPRPTWAALKRAFS